MRFKIESNDRNDELKTAGLHWAVLDREEHDACMCECYMEDEADNICNLLNVQDMARKEHDVQPK